MYTFVLQTCYISLNFVHPLFDGIFATVAACYHNHNPGREHGQYWHSCTTLAYLRLVIKIIYKPFHSKSFTILLFVHSVPYIQLNITVIIIRGLILHLFHDVSFTPDILHYFSSRQVIWSHIRYLDFIFPEPEAKGIFNPDKVYETILPFWSWNNIFVILVILCHFAKKKKNGVARVISSFFYFLSNLKTFCTIKKIRQNKNGLFNIKKPGKTLQFSRYSTVKTARRVKHSRRLKIVREKLAMTSRIMCFHDVIVKFPWRHAHHIYGCSRKYETIDPSKQPMRFPLFYLQFDIRTSCWQSVLYHGYNNILKTSEIENKFLMKWPLWWSHTFGLKATSVWNLMKLRIIIKYFVTPKYFYKFLSLISIVKVLKKLNVWRSGRNKINVKLGGLHFEQCCPADITCKLIRFYRTLSETNCNSPQVLTIC